MANPDGVRAMSANHVAVSSGVMSVQVVPSSLDHTRGVASGIGADRGSRTAGPSHPMAITASVAATIPVMTPLVGSPSVGLSSQVAPSGEVQIFGSESVMEPLNAWSIW